MKNLFLKILLAAMIILVAACSVSGGGEEQPKPTPPKPPEKGKATVIGRALDRESRHPLAGTLIKLAEVVRQGDDAAYALDPYFSPGATTDENGFFILENIPAGEYVLVVGNVETIYEIIQDESGRARVWKADADEILDMGEITADLSQ